MATSKKITSWLKSLSFQTGVMVAVACAVCYAISFAQMLLPIPVWLKGAIWFVFFGLAKACQYSALLILGKAGIERLRSKFKKNEA